VQLTEDAPPAPAAEPPLTVYEPRAGWSAADARELWRFRGLFWHLVLRDVKIRYKQTVLGVGWSVAQPLATVLVFAVFVGWMGRVADGVEGYTLFVLAGVLPWTFFANAVTTGANSLVGNERLVTKTYFPRLVLPGSCVGVALFDFLIGLGVLAVWTAAVGVAPTWRLALLPVVGVLLGLTALGVGALLAALISAQRDFRYLLSFGVQLWMFATPCLYLPPDRYPFGPEAQQWLAVNPAYGLILAFRACSLGGPIDWPALGTSAAVGLGLLAVGLTYFRRVESTLADTI
jgi:lipopolysaccharide transport system permease protein